MRKPRAIIYDDEVTILDMLKEFLSKRDYEVFSFSEPRVCPIYERYADRCSEIAPCADIVITDFRMPRMDGIELLKRQSQRGCKIDIRNKAIISGNMGDENIEKIRKSGCAFLNKPFKLAALSAWLNECETRFDLSRPLSQIEKRKSARYPYHSKIEYQCNNSEVSEGLTINMSESGICLYLFKDHNEGQDVIIKSSLPVKNAPPADPHKAIIRWVRNLQDTYWIAGLMFV